MLRSLVEWRDEITVVPYSGLQFLDFGFNIDDVTTSSSGFIERTTERGEDRDIRMLFALSGDDERDAKILSEADSDDEEYSISKVKALEPFLGNWVPVPLLRIRSGRGPRGEELLDLGPSTWARLFVTELDERDPESGHTHRVVLAIDTDMDKDGESETYLTPTTKDAEDEREFRLALNPDTMDWFLRMSVTDEDGVEVDVQKWVDDWLLDLFHKFKQAQRPNRELKPQDFPYLFEHWARYLAMLSLLRDAINVPKIRLLDTISDDNRYQPVEVDLVLDVGNSRTCGILIESYPDESGIDLNNSFALAMRDLGRPELSYRRPFESRVEFAQAAFGLDHVARRSGRTRPAFMWPSLVRVGPEAVGMMLASEGTETLSGLSSPKRYLWDNHPLNQDWRFRNATSGQHLPVIARSAFRFVNEAGDVIEQIKEEETRKLRRRGETSTASAIRARFSRSSLYGFMLAELFCHALAQINDPGGRATRKQSDLPRRLRNIILTMPSATPVQEQSIMRSRAEGAIKLIWSVLNWSEDLSTNCRKPRVIVDWDEASCTQLVYLYDEISQKFGGQIEAFFELKGRKRRRSPDKPEEISLRVACIDVGGGTSDLMVTTFFNEDNRAIRPRQDFREGFRVAGDDLVREIICRVVLPQIRESIEASGGTYVTEMLRELFGGDIGDVQEQFRQRRRQFALSVLQPMALAVLIACESLKEGDTRVLHIADVISRNDTKAPKTADGAAEAFGLAPALCEFIEKAARTRGADDWKLEGVSLEVNPIVVDSAVRDVLGPALDNMIEMTSHLGCDILLLSGRTAKQPAVREIVRERLAVTPDRLISMHEFRVGNWYPYRDQISNRVGDPKTTAVVGGMLCLLSESRIQNFKFYASDIFMRSTAHYIGEMEINGQIKDENLLFKNVDLDSSDTAAGPAEVLLRSPIHIGFRQLKLERWTATPLYRMDFANESVARRPTPLKVTIRRREFETDVQKKDDMLRAEALKEAFVIEEVEDAVGDGCRASDVKLTLHTLGIDENDYWLDTGVFRVN